MPITLESRLFLKAYQTWIICGLCSLSFAIIAYKNYSFDAIDAITYSVTKRTKPDPGGCPFLFNGSHWEITGVPLALPEYFWNFNIDLQNVANTAFFTGKTIISIPAGAISDIGYSRHVLLGGMSLVAGNLFFLSVFPKAGQIFYLVANFFDGIGEGLIYPSVLSLVSRWAPPSARNLYTALVVAGLIYGDSVGHILFKFTYLQFKSWRIGVFITGIIVALWIVSGFIFIHPSPDESPFRRRDSISNETFRTKSLLFKLKQLKTIPWKDIFHSLPLLSLILAFCSVNWTAFSNLWLSYEDYQKYVLRLPEAFSKESTLVAIAVVPSTVIAGLLSDWITERDIVSRTTVKKTFASFGVFSSSVLQVMAASVGCNIELFWVLFVTSYYLLGLAQPAIYTSPVDLSPRNAGLLMGILYGGRTIVAIIKAKTDQLLITDLYSASQWRDFIIINSVLSSVLLIPFLWFGSGELQRWKVHKRPRSVLRTQSVAPTSSPSN